MYALVTTSHFDRRAAKFTRTHPELKKHLAKILRDLESDPFQPHLRLHALKGALEGLHAVSVTASAPGILVVSTRPASLGCLGVDG